MSSAGGSSRGVSNPNRYCDYVHRLQRVSGLPSDLINRDILPLRDIPHADDPRRERSLCNVIEIGRSRDELPLLVLAKGEELDYQRLLRRIVIAPSRLAPIGRALHIPNTRDPRRVKACERAKYEAWSIGPPTLVENGTVPAEEETCPVLMIDASDWPRSKHCWIELCPHECNVARSQLLQAESASNDVNLQLLADNNTSDELAVASAAATEAQRKYSLEMEIIDEKSVFDMGNDNESMLGLDTNDLYVECVVDVSNKKSGRERKFSDSEVIPFVKEEAASIRLRDNAEPIDFIDLSVDDDEGNELALKRKIKNEHEQRKRIPELLEIVTIDDDDEMPETTFVALRNDSSIISHKNTCIKINEKQTVDASIFTFSFEKRQEDDRTTKIDDINNPEKEPIQANLLITEITDTGTSSNNCTVVDHLQKCGSQNKLILDKVVDDNSSANTSVALVTKKPSNISESVMVLSYELRRYFASEKNNVSEIPQFYKSNSSKSSNTIIIPENNVEGQNIDFVASDVETNIGDLSTIVPMDLEICENAEHEKVTNDFKLHIRYKDQTSIVDYIDRRRISSNNFSVKAQMLSNKVLNIFNNEIKFKNSVHFKETKLQSVKGITAEKRKRENTPEKNLSLMKDNSDPHFFEAKRHKPNMLSLIENCGTMSVEHLIKNDKQNKKKQEKKKLQMMQLFKLQERTAIKIPEVIMKSLKHSYTIWMLLSNYIFRYNFAANWLYYYSNNCTDVSFNKFGQSHNNKRRDHTFCVDRYTYWNQQKDEGTIKDITESKNCILENISYSTFPNKDNIITGKHNPWQEKTFIEISDSFEQCLPTAVIENDTYKSDELQVNLNVDNLDIDLSYNQNLCKSAIPKNNYKENSSNILNALKIEKRHSLPTAIVPQHSCVKKSRTNSCDLPSYMEKNESIIYSLQNDNLSHKYCLTFKNNTSNLITSSEDICNNSNNEEKTSEIVNYKKNSIFGKASSSIKRSYNLNEKNFKLTACTDKKVPELEINYHQSSPLIINETKLEDSLSTFLKSKVKRKNTDISISLNKDNKSNKRLKVPDKFVKKVQPNISNETNFIVQTTSESSLNVEKSLKISYSEVLPKTHPSTLNMSSADNTNLNSDNVNTPSIVNMHSSDLDDDTSKNINQNNHYALMNSTIDLNNDSFNDNLNNSHIIKLLAETSKSNIKDHDHKLGIDYNYDLKDNTNKEKKSSNQTEKFNPNIICQKNLSLISEIRKSFTPTKLDKLKKKFRILFEDSDTSEIEEQSEFFSVTISENISDVRIQENIESEKIVRTSLPLNTFDKINPVSKNSKSTKRVSSNLINKNENNLNDLQIENVSELELCKEKELENIHEENVSTITETEGNHLHVICKTNHNESSKSANNRNFSPSLKNKVIEESIEVMSVNSAKELFNIDESNKNFTRDKSIKLEQIKENCVQKEHGQICNGIDLPITQIAKDQVLPDSTQLDENLEGGDFDFLSSIHNAKHGSENSDDDYDMDSDPDVHYGNVNIDCFKHTENVQKTEDFLDKSDDVKCKNTETVDLHELNIQKDAHYLEKLPSFYNEYITNVVNNEVRENNDHITILECISSNSDNKLNKVKCEKHFNPEVIDLELSNESTRNSKNAEDIKEQEVRITQSDNVLETTSTKNLNKCFDLQDYIISLCEASVDPEINEFLTLPTENKTNSLSTTICDNESNIASSELSINTKPLSTVHNKDSISNSNLTKRNNKLNSDPIQNSDFAKKNEICSYKNNQVLDSEIHTKMIEKPVASINDLKNSNILQKFNLVQESEEPEEIKVESSTIHKRNIEQQTLCENLENIVNSITQKNYNLQTASATFIEKNQSSIITSNKLEKSTVFSPLILEVKVPNVHIGSEEDYDLLENINVHVVNEIDEINIISELSETTVYKSQTNRLPENYCSTRNEIIENCSNLFKLRDINELLENRKDSLNQNSVGVITSQSISVSSARTVRHQNICTTDTITNSNLPANMTFDSKAHNNVPTSQTMFSIPNNETKDTVHSRSNETKTLNSPIYSVSKCTLNAPSSTMPCTSSTIHSNLLQDTSQSQRNHIFSDSISQISLSNINQKSYTYKLASTIFTDLFDSNDSLKLSKNNTDNSGENISAVKRQENIFTMDLPSLKTLSLPSPFTININDSEMIIHEKIKNYKTMLLKKIILSLRSMVYGSQKSQFQHMLGSFEYMTTLTIDVWKFQLNLITIVQCIHKLFMFFANKSYKFRITAIANTLRLRSTQDQSNQLETLLNIYCVLNKRGIISSKAHKMEPLYEELDRLRNEQQSSNINSVMSIEQRRQFNIQVQIYSDIYKVNIDQCKLQQSLTANTAAGNKKSSLKNFRKTQRTPTNKETKQKKSNKSTKVLTSMSSLSVPNGLCDKVNNEDESSIERSINDNT